jgi:hypothetical protein
MQFRIRPLPLSGDPSEDRAAFIGCVVACLLVFGRRDSHTRDVACGTPAQAELQSEIC